MKRNIYFPIVLLMIFISAANAQIQTIVFQNPSFEGTPGTPHVAPPLWDLCQPGTTPDTQPGCWGVTLPPADGNSYIGLVDQASGGWHEGVSQYLGTPLVAGTTYAFSISLATTNSTDGGIQPGCVELNVYLNMGGNSGCDMTMLAWNSGDIYDIAHINNWVTHTVMFTATQNWTNILFMIHNLGCTDQPYVLMDNFGPAQVPVFNDHDIVICSNPATISANAGFNTYLWSTGDTTQSTTVTSSGMYYVTATVNNNDTIDSVHVTLTQPYLNLDLGNDTLTCGNAMITLDAGSGFSYYHWNTDSFAQSIIVYQTGVYSVYATDTAYCVYYDTIDVAINPALSLDLGNDTAMCNYGSVTLDASCAFNSYLWSTGATTQTITVSSSGSYAVTVNNAQCSVMDRDTVLIIFNAVPVANAGVDDTICKGSSTTLQATGGNNYLWSPGTNLSCTNCANPLASPQQNTNYHVTVTNTYGCQATDEVTIKVSTISSIANNASCGSGNGTATVYINGGSGNYAYSWSTNPVQQTQTAINLAPGSYTVTATDVTLGCSLTKSVSIINIPGPVLNVAGILNANCGMNNGAMIIAVTGGTSPFSYLWNTTPAQTSQNLANVPVGYYCLSVTDTNNCVVTICDSVRNEAYPAPEICMVTVDTASDYNIVVWEKPVTTGIDKYYIFRESNISGIYNLIGVQNFSVFSTFTDNTSNSLQQSYRYKLAINDFCGFTSQQSPFHQTLHLTINAGMGGAWNLIWNDYLGFTFSTYNIYRGTNSGSLTMINSVANNVTAYTDLNPPAGTIYYMVEVVRPTPCYPSAKTNDFLSAISNIASTDNLGMPETGNEESLQIMPNPATEVISISISGQYRGTAEIEMMNSLGQLVLKDVQNTKIKTIDISAFPKGIYYFAVRINEKVLYKKIVIQ